MKSTTLAGLVLSILAVIHLGDAAVNYCLSAYHCSGVYNIGCGNTGAFSSACPTGTKMVRMTAALKAAILKSHTTKMNTLEADNLTGFSPIVRTATMVWDHDMAILAAYNAKRCIFELDQCPNTAKYSVYGQNIAKTWLNGEIRNYTSIILPQIDIWWSEFSDASNYDYPGIQTSVIIDFTESRSEGTIALGCAAIRFADAGMNNWTSLTLVCNYGTTSNDTYLPVYTSGRSDCGTGNNANFEALRCGANDPSTVNVAFG